MTSLKDSIDSIIGSLCRNIEDGNRLTTAQWADDYIRKFEQHMIDKIPTGPLSEPTAYLWNVVIIEMKRFLRGETP